MVFSRLFEKSQSINKETERSKRTENRSESEVTGRSAKRRRLKKKNDEGTKPGSKQPDNGTQRTSLSKNRKKGPCQDALQLSEKLKTLSRNKNLSAVLELYWDRANDNIRDSHHCCIVVDCCARSGSVSEGEKIVNKMKISGLEVNVETKTALLKGYALSGMIAKAASLFESMCRAKGEFYEPQMQHSIAASCANAETAKRDLPNSRSLNTLLRGCLWSACRPGENGDVVGGVVTAEKAWRLCQELQDRGKIDSIFDVSSYEYSVSMLCQALRTTEGVSRINDMRNAYLSSGVSCADQSVSEALSIAYLALARAYYILDEKENALNACKTSLEFVTISQNALVAGTHLPKGKSELSVVFVSLDASLSNEQVTAIVAGARHGSEFGRRNESNAIFRKHRLCEVERECRVIVEICSKSDFTVGPRQVARRLLTRLIVLSGGGTTPDSSHDNFASSDGNDLSSSLQTQVLNTAYFSYGFDTLAKRLNIPMREGIKVLKRRDCNRLLGLIGLQGGIVQMDGAIDFRRIFSAGIGNKKSRKSRGKKARRMEIELGAGFGDWIVKKAIENPSTNFLSVELRADRVGQTFAKTSALASVNPLENLCIVGAESRSFLLHHVRGESVSAIYVNHPEPPTQTSGLDSHVLKSIMDGGHEPSHMLNSNMIIAACKCLSTSNGRMIIVTDNRWYGRLICATVIRVLRTCKGLVVPVELSKEDDNFELCENVPGNYQANDAKGIAGTSVGLYQGQPNESIGHRRPDSDSNEFAGSSYFDRLWRSGGGTHAETNTRFVVVLTRRAPVSDKAGAISGNSH